MSSHLGIQIHTYCQLPSWKWPLLDIFSLSGESADFLKERNSLPLPLAMHGAGAQKSILYYVQRPYDQNQSCRILEEKRERHFSLWEILGCPFMTCRWEARAQVSPRSTGPLGTSSCWGERWSLGLAKEMVHSNNGTFLRPLNRMRSGHMNSGGKMIRMNAKGSRKQNAKWRQGGHLRSVQVKGAYLLYSTPLWTMGGCFLNNFTIWFYSYRKKKSSQRKRGQGWWRRRSETTVWIWHLSISV